MQRLLAVQHWHLPATFILSCLVTTAVPALAGTIARMLYARCESDAFTCVYQYRAVLLYFARGA